jgi:hypothetical protein
MLSGRKIPNDDDKNVFACATNNKTHFPADNFVI